MKKFINNIKKRVNNYIISRKIKASLALANASEVLTSNKGESESTGSTVLIIGALVVGALVIGLLVVLFRDTLWPLVTSAAEALFNIK